VLEACLEIRKTVLRASCTSGHGHIPTSFSIIEMLWAAYATMDHRADSPDWPDRDLFLLSKGHAALGHYGVLAELGYISKQDLATFGAFGSNLGCHPDRQKVAGVEASTGSLGHGIGIAVGMALALKIKKSPRKVITLIGDGESNEGSVWEAVMVAVNCKLDNLTIMYDDNRSQSRCLQIMDPAACLKSFGLDVRSVNGHDCQSMIDLLNQSPVPDRPRALVCSTVKGYGCPTLSNDVFSWHRRSPKPEELDLLLQELEEFKGDRKS
jgi:transketolase